MDIASLSSGTSQTIGTQLLQQLQAMGTGTQDSSSLTTLLGDNLTLSSTAKQLAQAPTAVTQAMTDLLSAQKDVSGDLAQLKTWFQQNPQRLAGIVSSLQGGTSTYSASSALGSNSALVGSLLSGKNSGAMTGQLLNLLLGTSGSQDPLLASLGDSSSTDGTVSGLFG